MLNSPLKMERLYAFVVEEPNGEEGIMAFMDPAQQRWMPMIGSELSMVEELKEGAKAMAEKLNKTVKLISFTKRQDIEIIHEGERAEL